MLKGSALATSPSDFAPASSKEFLDIHDKNIQSQCDIVIFKITGEIEYLHVFLLEAYRFCYFNQT